MAIYTFCNPDSGSATPYTPTVGSANWILESTTAVCPPGQRRLIAFEWGSEEAESNGVMRTRIARDSAVGTGARTTLVLDREDIIIVGTITSAYGTYAVTGGGAGYGTTQPTIVNGALYARAWPVGGGVEHDFPPGGGITLYGVASIECRQDIGAFASTYGGKWEE